MLKRGKRKSGLPILLMLPEFVERKRETGLEEVTLLISGHVAARRKLGVAISGVYVHLGQVNNDSQTSFLLWQR
jgi:hypothetical protein